MNLNHIGKKPFWDLFYKKPVMVSWVRAAMYDASLRGASGNAVGPQGTMCMKAQMNIAKSPELLEVQKALKEIASDGNHITADLTGADLIQLGGYAAVEYLGGPQLVFRMGRKDVKGDSNVIQHAPETHFNSLQVSQLQALNLAPEDYVALLGGSQTIGFHSAHKKGPQSRWTKNPYVFDNTYFQMQLLREENIYYRNEHDIRLLQNPATKEWIEKYAEDQDLFFANFAKAFVALSELNCPELHSELNDEFTTVDGGYQEPSYYKRFALWWNRDQTLDEPEENLRTLGEINDEHMAQFSIHCSDHHDDDHDHHDDHHGHDDHHDEPKKLEGGH